MKNILKKFGLSPKLAIMSTLLIVGLLFPETAFAEDKETLDDVISGLQKVISVGLGIVHAVFWPICLMIGSLMDNDLIFGPGIGERLREIWVTMRNIVNIVFVFVLLVVAFYNVTGMGGEGNLALKTILPKFIMALIAVNFSFLGCKVILDAANVVSTSVYDIAGTVEGYDAETIKRDMEKTICTNPKYLISEGGSDAEGVTGAAGESGAEGDAGTSEGWSYDTAGLIAKAFCCNDGKYEDNTPDAEVCSTYAGGSGTEDPEYVYPTFNNFGDSFFYKLDQNNIGVVMAVNLGGLNELTSLADKETFNLKDLAINTLFSVLMYVVFGFAYVALFIVLLARLVVLWLCIALSPLIVLMWVLPQVKEYAQDLNLGEKFIKHLMAPIIIGLAMSIGLLLAMAVKNSGTGGSVETTVGEQSLDDILLQNDAVGTLLTPNISDLQQLMVAAIAVAIVWLGVFGAASQTIASSVTDKIKGWGQDMGKTVAGLPKYLPFVPIVTKEGDVQPSSFADIAGVMKELKYHPWVMPNKEKVNKILELIPGMNPPSPEITNLKTELARAQDTPGKKDDLEIIRQVLRGEKGVGAADFQRLKDEVLAGVIPAGELSSLTSFDKFKAWYKDKGRGALTEAGKAEGVKFGTWEQEGFTLGSGGGGGSASAEQNKTTVNSYITDNTTNKIKQENLYSNEGQAADGTNVTIDTVLQSPSFSTNNAVFDSKGGIDVIKTYDKIQATPAGGPPVDPAAVDPSTDPTGGTP